MADRSERIADLVRDRSRKAAHRGELQLLRPLFGAPQVVEHQHRVAARCCQETQLHARARLVGRRQQQLAGFAGPRAGPAPVCAGAHHRGERGTARCDGLVRHRPAKQLPRGRIHRTQSSVRRDDQYPLLEFGDHALRDRELVAQVGAAFAC
ncbi:MAG TPA: hypothetical protein PK177_05640, partial [Burkholderiaceae bacterium]|nr:hypothetical protein [Burkholderiaceae bacterium]